MKLLQHNDTFCIFNIIIGTNPGDPNVLQHFLSRLSKSKLSFSKSTLSISVSYIIFLAINDVCCKSNMKKKCKQTFEKNVKTHNSQKK